jgi:hypothetical protein
VVERSERQARRIETLFALIAVSLLLHTCNVGCWFAPCDEAIGVTAIVTDSSGAPVRGARAELLGQAAATDQSGCAEFRGITHVRELELQVTAPGHQKYAERKPYGIYQVNIVLAGEGPSARSTGTWKRADGSWPRAHCQPDPPSERPNG